MGFFSRKQKRSTEENFAADRTGGADYAGNASRAGSAGSRSASGSANSSRTAKTRATRTAKNAADRTAKTKATKASKAEPSKKSKVGILQKTPAQIMMPRLLLIASVVILAAIGLVMVYSASSVRAYTETGNPSFYVVRQAAFMGIGIIVCVLLCAFSARFSYHFLANKTVFSLLWALTTFMLIATQAGLGVTQLGAERSIVIAGIPLQSAEFAKITTILSAASLLSMFRQKEIEFSRFAISIAVVIIVPVIFIFLQPDLGTVIILLVGVLTVAILGGIVWQVILAFIGIAALYAVFVCIIQPYHLERLATLLDPWADPSGDGYQSIQSLYALALGGVNGSGLGFSQEKYLYLPYAHTDFIFAVLGEEFGLIGTVFVVLLFALFAYAGILICRNAPDLLGCMLAGAFTVMIVFQACVNMSCVIGLIPVTGKALPFLSYGGSSLLATFIMVGIILSVSFSSQVDVESKKRRAAFSVVGANDNAAGRDGGGAVGGSGGAVGGGD